MEIAYECAMFRFDIYALRDRLFNVALQNDYRKWGAIRGIYKTINTKRFTAYPVDWTRIFTPIESCAWGEIRYYGLPFFPQFPIKQYFADFADPIKKIVVECDGKNYHDKSSDARRDAAMAEEGWTVYRISGADCKRIIDAPWEEIYELEIPMDSYEAEQLIRNWMFATVDGLMAAISAVHYGKPMKHEIAQRIAEECLRSRNHTRSM